MDTLAADSDLIQNTLRSWEELNGLLKDAVWHQNWTEVESILSENRTANEPSRTFYRLATF